MYDSFETSTPEAEGVSSKGIADFLNALFKYDINIHSVLMFRNFKLIFDGYYKPFDENTLHRMFSVTKSFVSAGIGILIGKGKINIDEPVINYFPEYNLPYVSHIVKKATIKNLLEMKSPHEKTAFKQINDDNYVKSFFTLKPSKFPGTAFSYDTSASHTLCALIEKISGKSLLDFLRDEFLEELGFSKEAYCVKDPLGISLGGSGIMAKPIDIALFAHLFLNGGRLWGESNRQVIPAGYAKDAVSKRSETFVKGAASEEKYGYGYQFWRTSHNGYMCYGIAGQLAVILPDFNFVMITTADTLETQNGVNRIFELFWDTVYKGFSDSALAENKKGFSELLEIKNNLAVKAIKCEQFHKKDYEKLLWSFSVAENEHKLKNLMVQTGEGMGKISFLCDKGEFNIKFGFGRHEENTFPFYNYRCIASGAFFSERCLIVKCHIIDEEIGAVYIQIDFNENGQGTLLTKKNVVTGFEEFNKCYLIELLQ